MNDTTYTGILLYPRFSEYELSVLLSVLQQGGKKVLYIGLEHQVVKGEAGLPCIPETTIQEVDISKLDSIVLPGVDDFEHLVDHKELSAFIKRINAQGKIIGAISSAPYLLAQSGVLCDRKYTTGLTAEQRAFLGGFTDAYFVDAPTVVDGQIVTARGSAFVDFAFKYGELLQLHFQKNWYVQR
ncbi:DJ-1/PfpI family protein [Jeotgalibacillus terrae]|uniref:DJ-1/PfpI family protein n=1 Tax=Jeotgalibacillus terrae TaxID=587735 RepID=A0ABW5ZJS6_9BACL|nr:DJ-1/PfpI family protein [Jeotgalibacillus terrae]MBM7578691.1 putative intracellular protease/amidase [Jeotgalibacillus terrae]